MVSAVDSRLGPDRQGQAVVPPGARTHRRRGSAEPDRLDRRHQPDAESHRRSDHLAGISAQQARVPVPGLGPEVGELRHQFDRAGRVVPDSRAQWTDLLHRLDGTVLFLAAGGQSGRLARPRTGNHPHQASRIPGLSLVRLAFQQHELFALLQRGYRPYQRHLSRDIARLAPTADREEQRHAVQESSRRRQSPVQGRFFRRRREIPAGFATRTGRLFLHEENSGRPLPVRRGFGLLPEGRLRHVPDPRTGKLQRDRDGYQLVHLRGGPAAAGPQPIHDHRPALRS
jgi:hypothetical protein